MMQAIVLLPFGFLALGIFLAWTLPKRGVFASMPRLGWLLSVFPLSSFLLILYTFSLVPSGKALTFSIPWIPSLGLNFSFYLDGLSTLFALLVTGLGTLITIYTGDERPPHRGTEPTGNPSPSFHSRKYCRCKN